MLRGRERAGRKDGTGEAEGSRRAEMIRYQIRNEYGLADPEMYAAPGDGEEDDPEALLEGVAMAGLVGVLRQLGDLAE